jgi:cation:H+ antiporter
MHAIETLIATNQIAAWAALIISFAILAKCADIFVDSAVGIAASFGIPKLVIGIVLVSLATTAPELAVSLMSALEGHPEMALGNAIGSVICDDGLALGMAGLFATAPIMVMPRVLRTSGAFLIGVEILAFLFVFRDYTLERWEGAVLVIIFASYMLTLFQQHKSGKMKDDLLEDETVEMVREMSLAKMAGLFAVGLVGIILASDVIVMSATSIASAMGIPESVVALTLVALGTSIPEVATCIVAARKGHGPVAVGNILGADIMNICWVAGASALANELTLGTTPEEGHQQVYFMFPAMFVIVLVMLILLRMGHNLNRWKGGVLLAIYIGYLVFAWLSFPPEALPIAGDVVP